MASTKRWLPLEANPDIMNQFLWGLGLQEDGAKCCDVYGLDEKLLEIMVPKPVLAVFFLYPITTQVTADKVALSSGGQNQKLESIMETGPLPS
ncbi:hypothetical protein JHK87_027914 [Glycine soja]|nr:hypothetical protein JHK87_027914 [Glycine soja]